MPPVSPFSTLILTACVLMPLAITPTPRSIVVCHTDAYLPEHLGICLSDIMPSQVSANRADQALQDKRSQPTNKIVEAVLTDYLDERTFPKGAKIVFDPRGFDNFETHNPRIVVGDMSKVWAEKAKAKSQPNYMMELDTSGGTYFWNAFQTFYPGCEGYVYVYKTMFLQNGTVIVQLSIGPGAHGLGHAEYHLRAKGKRWKIIKRSFRFPQ